MYRGGVSTGASPCNCIHWNSSCHNTYADNALIASNMIAKPGGKQHVMRNTVGEGRVQKIVIDFGVPTGLIQVLKERGRYMYRAKIIYQYVLCTSIFPPSLLVQCTVLYMYTGVTAYIAQNTCTPTPHPHKHTPTHTHKHTGTYLSFSVLSMVMSFITTDESDLNSKLQTCGVGHFHDIS